MTVAFLLLGLGLLLIVAEVFFPSLGLLGVLATAAIVGAIVMAFKAGSGPSFTLVVAIVVPMTVMLGMRLFPKSPLGKHMVLGGPSFEVGVESDSERNALLGRTGIVEAALRPAGIARIEGGRMDVVSRGEAIEKGALVRVIDIHGNRIVVNRVAASEQAAGADQESVGSSDAPGSASGPKSSMSTRDTLSSSTGAGDKSQTNEGDQG